MSEQLSLIPDESKNQITKLEQFSSVEEMKSYAEYLIKSKLLPPAYNSPEKVIIAIQKGESLPLFI